MGLNDPLIEGNRLLHRLLTEAGIAHAYEEISGVHTWDYGHEQLADSLRFLSGSTARG